MEYKELIGAFLAKYGLAAPPGEEKIGAVEIDGTSVTLREDAAAGALILSAEVDDMPPDENGRFASILLKASGLLSANAEGAFCVDDDDVFHAVRSVPLALADIDSLSAAVEGLVALVAEWRGRLGGDRPADHHRPHAEAAARGDGRHVLSDLLAGQNPPESH